MKNNFRLELSFKDLSQLEKKIQFCIKNNIQNLNIPCKGKIKKDFLLNTVKFIGENYNYLNIVYHYSLFHQYSMNVSESYKSLLTFLQLCKLYNNIEILIVSGSTKKHKFDVLEVLKKLKNDLKLDINIGVVYNPYFPDQDSIKNERERLEEKLSSGLINSIWLQAGSDLDSLRKETKFIKFLLNKFSTEEKKYSLYGSLFIPSKQFIARFKFRPWKEVFISSDYLNSLEKANLITKNINNFYLKNKILPLIESECCSDNQLENLLKMIRNK